MIKIINASAGSGKTTLIINEIIRISITNQSMKKILCLTLTNSAVDEIKNRILREILTWDRLEKKEVINKWSSFYGVKHIEEENYYQTIKNIKQDFLLGKIKITTIHSWCLELIKLDRSQDPHLKLIDSNTQENIFKDLYSDYLIHENKEKLFEKDLVVKEDLKQLLQANSFLDSDDYEKITPYIERSKENTQNKLIKCFLQYLGYNSQQKLSSVYIKFKNKKNTDEVAIDKIIHCVDLANNIIEQAKKLTNTPEKQLEKITQHLIDELSKTEIFEVLFGSIKKVVFCTNGSLRKSTANILTTAELEYELQNIKAIEEYMDSLSIAKSTCNLIIKFNFLNRLYNKKKKEKNLYDYNDLLLLARDRIIDINLLFNLIESTDYFLLDEAQDNNSIQCDILISLCKELILNNRFIFIVGDIKQCIYGFSGSSVYLYRGFLNHLITFAKENHIEVQQVFKNTTHRSTTSVIEKINYIFNKSCFYKYMGFEDGFLLQESLSEQVGDIYMHKHNTDHNSFKVFIVEKIKSLLSTQNKEKIMLIFLKKNKLINEVEELLKTNKINYEIKPNKNKEPPYPIISLIGYLLDNNNKLYIAIILRYFFNFNRVGIFVFFYKRNKMPEELTLFANYYKKSQDVISALLFLINKLTINKEKKQEIDEYISYVNHTVVENPTIDIRRLVCLLDSTRSFPNSCTQPKEMLVLSTVHSAKGTEADKIIIIDENNGYLPRNIGFSDYLRCFIFNNFTITSSCLKEMFLGEYIRLLYVALTRSKKDVYFLSSHKKINHHNWTDIISESHIEK